MNQQLHIRFTSLFIVTLSVIFFSTVSLAQNSSHQPLKKIKEIGIEINHFPGAYEKSIQLIIKGNDPKVKLQYKTGWNAENNFQDWRGSITITSNTFIQIKVSNGSQESQIYQGNYIVGRDHQLPIICLKVNSSEFFPPDGIYVGTVEKITGQNEHFEVSGKAFEKKPIQCYAEFIYGGKSVEATSCWLKTFGGLTLGMPEKSLHLVADSSLGKKKFEYRFFANKPYNSFEHLVLRTSGNDQSSTRFKDICLSSLAADMGVDYMDYQPCSFYVNDQYFGIINLREKINQDYLKYNHHTISDSTEIGTASASDNPEYQRFMKWLSAYPSSDQFKKDIQSKIDLEEYMNFIIWQTFICNSDSRGNIRFWKSKNLDNKWRWIFYDSDLSCGPKASNFLADKTSSEQTAWYNPTWSTLIFRKIANEKSTRDLVINQMCLLQATAIHPDTVQNRINHFKQWIEPEFPFHCKRYPAKSSMNGWSNHIGYMKQFFKKREISFHKEMCEVFKLDTLRQRITIQSNFPKLDLVTANESSLRFKRIDGLFYSGRTLMIKAINRFPYQFSHWKEDKSKNQIFAIPLDKNQTWTAVYNKAEWDSSLCKTVGIHKWGTEMSRKKELFWLEIVNLSSESIPLEKCQLHYFENDLSIQLPNQSWNANSSIILTNNRKKWKKQFPEYKGEIVEVSIPLSFASTGTWLLNYNGRICDSLHFNIPDSLLNNNSKWLVISDSTGIHYMKWKQNNWDFSKFRKVPLSPYSVWTYEPKSIMRWTGSFFILISIFGLTILKRKSLQDE